jgi:hypothetical protein
MGHFHISFLYYKLSNIYMCLFGDKNYPQNDSQRKNASFMQNVKKNIYIRSMAEVSLAVDYNKLTCFYIFIQSI